MNRADWPGKWLVYVTGGVQGMAGMWLYRMWAEDQIATLVWGALWLILLVGGVVLLGVADDQHWEAEGV